MNELMLNKIENALDDYISTYVDYHYSQTCCNDTFKRQEQTMYDKRYELLALISNSLPKE